MTKKQQSCLHTVWREMNTAQDGLYHPLRCWEWADGDMTSCRLLWNEIYRRGWKISGPVHPNGFQIWNKYVCCDGLPRQWHTVHKPLFSPLADALVHRPFEEQQVGVRAFCPRMPVRPQTFWGSNPVALRWEQKHRQITTTTYLYLCDRYKTCLWLLPQKHHFDRPFSTSDCLYLLVASTSHLWHMFYTLVSRSLPSSAVWRGHR